MKMIEQLYYGNIMGSEFEHSREWRKLSPQVLKQYNDLIKSLSSEQTKQFDAWLDLHLEQYALERMEVYKYALGVGNGLGFESCEIHNK